MMSEDGEDELFACSKTLLFHVKPKVRLGFFVTRSRLIIPKRDVKEHKGEEIKISPKKEVFKSIAIETRSNLGRMESRLLR